MNGFNLLTPSKFDRWDTIINPLIVKALPLNNEDALKELFLAALELPDENKCVDFINKPLHMCLFFSSTLTLRVSFINFVRRFEDAINLYNLTIINVAAENLAQKDSEWTWIRLPNSNKFYFLRMEIPNSILEE